MNKIGSIFIILIAVNSIASQTVESNTSVSTNCSVSNCKDCTANRTVCTRCEANFRLNSNQCDACPEGCAKCDAFVGACEECQKGHFVRGGVTPNLQCSKCVDYCDECKNATTCERCQVLAKKTPENTCELDKVKIAVVIGITVGVFCFCVICIVACCCYSKKDKKYKKAKKYKGQKQQPQGFGQPNYAPPHPANQGQNLQFANYGQQGYPVNQQPGYPINQQPGAPGYGAPQGNFARPVGYN